MYGRGGRADGSASPASTNVYGRGGRADGLTFYHKSSVCSRAAYEGDSQRSARVGSRPSLKGTSIFHRLAIRLCTMSIKLVIKSQGDGSASLAVQKFLELLIGFFCNTSKQGGI